MVKQFLSYLPSHNGEPPPVMPVPDGSDEAIKDILEVVPESRSRIYDSREVITRVLDRDSHVRDEAALRQVAGHGPCDAWAGGRSA